MNENRDDQFFLARDALSVPGAVVGGKRYILSNTVSRAHKASFTITLLKVSVARDDDTRS